MVLWQQIGDIAGAKVVRSPDFGDVVLLPVPGLGIADHDHMTDSIVGS